MGVTIGGMSTLEKRKWSLSEGSWRREGYTSRFIDWCSALPLLRWSDGLRFRSRIVQNVLSPLVWATLNTPFIIVALCLALPERLWYFGYHPWRLEHFNGTHWLTVNSFRTLDEALPFGQKAAQIPQETYRLRCRRQVIMVDIL